MLISDTPGPIAHVSESRPSLSSAKSTGNPASHQSRLRRTDSTEGSSLAECFSRSLASVRLLEGLETGLALRNDCLCIVAAWKVTRL
jgi:hypothetical protein